MAAGAALFVPSARANAQPFQFRHTGSGCGLNGRDLDAVRKIVALGPG